MNKLFCKIAAPLSLFFLLSASPVRDRHIRFVPIFSSVTSPTVMSSLTAYIYLVSDLPYYLFPGSSILSILLPIHPSSFVRKCPYHLSLASHAFSRKRPTCDVPLMYSFLISSIIVTPNENRNIFNSDTSIYLH